MSTTLRMDLLVDGRVLAMNRKGTFSALLPADHPATKRFPPAPSTIRRIFVTCTVKDGKVISVGNACRAWKE